MSLLEDLLAGAVGYGIASSKKSKVVGDIIDNNINTSKLSLDELIDNYALRHYNTKYVCNELAHELHRIARRYEEYDYKNKYGNW